MIPAENNHFSQISVLLREELKHLILKLAKFWLLQHDFESQSYLDAWDLDWGEMLIILQDTFL